MSDPQWLSDKRAEALLATHAEIAGRFEEALTFDEALARITHTAVDAIDGCDSASITLLVGGSPRTEGATSDLSAAGDVIQYEEGEGPCLDAALTQARLIDTPDLARNPRWPRSATRIAAELGVGSMLSSRVALTSSPSRTLGGLNLYSTAVDGFTDDDRFLTVMLTSLSGIVLSGARERQNLRAAIESRQLIGEAIGILRAQSGISRDEAFAMLSSASQRMNVKLREVAERIAERVGVTD